MVASGWIAAAILIGVGVQRTGIPGAYVASSMAIAAAPAIGTLALLRYAAEKWAHAFVAFVWIGFAAVAASATGGFASPISAAFVLAPAFAMRLGGRAAAAEAAFFAALGYGVAGAVAAHPGLALGVLPACGAGLSIIAAGALIAAAAAAAHPVPAAAQAPQADAAALEDARRQAREIAAAYRRRAAELAHEFRTPLNHIIGFADVMRQRLFGPVHERYGEYVELIHTSGRNLLDLVNGVLDLSRLEAGRYPLALEDFDFRPIAEEAVRLMRDAAAAKSIALALSADESLPVHADAGALRQILANLLANAVKFTPEGGAVTARVRRSGRELVIEVEDTGPGIPAAERERLGAAFERGAAASAVEGYGLGLSLVRAFVGALGGTLSFHEARGGGALVRVSAPIARSA